MENNLMDVAIKALKKFKSDLITDDTDINLYAIEVGKSVVEDGDIYININDFEDEKNVVLFILESVLHSKYGYLSKYEDDTIYSTHMDRMIYLQMDKYLSHNDIGEITNMQDVIKAIIYKTLIILFE